MSEFNINSEFKALRNNKKKRQNKNRKIITTAITVLLVISLITALIIVITTNSRREPEQTITPPDSTQQIGIDPKPSDYGVTGKPSDTTVAPGTLPGTSSIKKRATTVFIDAGHGTLNTTGVLDIGAGAGSHYFNLSGGKYEDQLNLEVALKLRDLFEEAGYTVIMFREDRVNKALSVHDRAEIANNSDADVFVSVHANSAAEAACGTRVIYWNDRSDSAACLALGNKVKKEIESYGTAVSQKPVQVISQDVYVVRYTKMPAILVETCFVTNRKDAELAISDEWQQNMAQAIFDGVSAIHPLKITYEK